MALIIHLTKVPRYQDIVTDEYKTIPFEDVLLINKYFDWKRARENGVDCYSLKDWCGVSEDDMPHKYVVNYYGDFYNRKKVYNDYDGELMETETIFDDLARLVKTNQILNWLTTNVTNGIIDKEYHEISEEKFKNLCKALKRTRRAVSLDEDEFAVNPEIAKENLPIMDDPPTFWGPKTYNTVYAEQIVKVYDIVREILNTTDFEKETIYFAITSW